MAGYSHRDLYNFSKEVSEKASWILIPGKYTFDTKIIESDFNQKHNIVGYNPMESFITPFDFTPAGALIKLKKGYSAYKGGNKMISMGISGFGKRHRNKGVQDMIVSVLSKVYKPMINIPVSKGHGLSAGVADQIEKQSGGGSSLPSKPKPPGTYRPSVKKVKAYYVTSGESPCRKGYRFDEARGLCVRKK